MSEKIKIKNVANFVHDYITKKEEAKRLDIADAVSEQFHISHISAYNMLTEVKNHIKKGVDVKRKGRAEIWYRTKNNY